MYILTSWGGGGGGGEENWRRVMKRSFLSFLLLRCVQLLTSLVFFKKSWNVLGNPYGENAILPPLFIFYPWQSTREMKYTVYRGQVLKNVSYLCLYHWENFNNKGQQCCQSWDTVANQLNFYGKDQREGISLPEYQAMSSLRDEAHDG